jgi:hypothetical protein
LLKKAKKVYAGFMAQGGPQKEHQMTQAEKAVTIEGLYYVLYETAQNYADNTDTDEQARIIRKEASKFLAKVQKLQAVNA